MEERVLNQIEPKEVFYYFEDLSRIPRGSGNEKEVSEYLIRFAQEHDLEWHRDEVMNVLIKKPATKGYEDRPTVILQAHTDMVCEKNADTVHDFTKDPLKLLVDGDKVTADGTTLGADDGIGVAIALALLADEEAEHPAIELVCTSDEERGMSGVEQFDTSLLEGRVLINLDSDDEGVFVVGCAGGPVVRVELPLEKSELSKELTPIRIKIRGLKGGHSGEDIHRGRANSNKLMARVLTALERCEAISDLRLAELSGGLKYNAIPREADALVLVPLAEVNAAVKVVNEHATMFQSEYRVTDPEIHVTAELTGEKATTVLSRESQRRLLDYIYFSDTGIVRMDQELTDTVESSVSLGVVRIEGDKAVLQVMTRSSRQSMYMDMYYRICRLAESFGGTTEMMSNCPEWEYNPDSRLKETFTKVYEQMFGTEPSMMVLHAGLECGVFGKKIDEPVDMIAVGPDCRDLHTPGEYVVISSTQRFWQFFKEVIKNI